MNRLRQAEAALVKIYTDNNKNLLAEQILLAPDVFTAVAMMQQNKMFFGKGDFQAVLDQLGLTKSEKYKDVGNKLMAIKQGWIFRNEVQLPLTDAGFKILSSDEIELVAPEDKMSLYSDKKYSFTSNSIYYKYVFRVWATQIYGAEVPGISLAEMLVIFPEYQSKLMVYDMCCDHTGKIVKNNEYYTDYKNTPHTGGKRSGV